MVEEKQGHTQPEIPTEIGMPKLYMMIYSEDSEECLGQDFFHAENEVEAMKEALKSRCIEIHELSPVVLPPNMDPDYLTKSGTKISKG